MAVPQLIPVPQSNRITSFSSTDVATGKGYVTFYAGQTNGTPSLGLSLLQFYGDNVTSKTATFVSSVLPTFTKRIDRDYDIDFKQTTIVEGLCFVNVPNGVQNGDSSGQNHQHYVFVRLRKWDGTTETEIASAQGRTHANGSMAVNAEADTIDALSFTISSTKINAGESLRLTVEVWHHAGGAVNAKVFIGQDPKNRAVDEDAEADSHNWGTISTQITLQLPIKIEI